MSELIIEVGKYYQTRDGRKARIYALDGCAPHVVHGAILDEEGWEAYSGWRTSGKYFGEDDSSPRDLIAPWIDKPSFDRAIQILGDIIIAHQIDVSDISSYVSKKVNKNP